MNGAIQDHQIGKVSPRAFCPFDATRDPDLKYFKEVLENSLEPQEVAKFCDDFLKLLSYNKKDTRTKYRAWWETQTVVRPACSFPF